MQVKHDSKEDKCKQCQHYNVTYGFCRLEYPLGHCDHKSLICGIDSDVDDPNHLIGGFHDW